MTVRTGVRWLGWGSWAALVAYLAVGGATTSCGNTTPPIVVATATPTSTPLAICDALGKGTYQATCRVTPSVVHFGHDVDAAIDALIASKPQIFDLTKDLPKGSRQYLVVDKR